jgi:Flp pilus assembly protein TadD
MRKEEYYQGEHAEYMVGHRPREVKIELNERAEALMEDERWSDAIALIRSSKSFETDGDLSWNLGWSYFKLEDYAAAQSHLERATELAPTNAVAWWALGLAQRENGLLDEAELSLKHSLMLRDSSISRSALAIALKQRGKLVAAEQIHLTGLELKPESPKRWRAYACFLDDLGRRQEAEAAYRKARCFEGA